MAKQRAKVKIKKTTRRKTGGIVVITNAICAMVLGELRTSEAKS